MKNRLPLFIFTSLAILAFIALGLSISEFIKGEKVYVAYIEISGPIVYGADIDIDKLVETLKEINETDYISAIVFKIDSPGGSAVPVYRIVHTLDSINKTKVAYIDEIGTSGAYWIAAATDHIIANPYSEVGSIGAIFSYFQLSELLNKLGIRYVVIKEGKYKDLASPFRNLTDEEKKLLEEQIEILYKDFVNYVKQRRNVSDDVFESGVYIGKVAKDKGLVDEIGDFDKVKEYLAKKFNTSEDNIVFIKYDVHREKDIFEKLFGIFFDKIITNLLYSASTFQLAL